MLVVEAGEGWVEPRALEPSGSVLEVRTPDTPGDPRSSDLMASEQEPSTRSNAVPWLKCLLTKQDSSRPSPPWPVLQGPGNRARGMVARDADHALGSTFSHQQPSLLP